MCEHLQESDSLTMQSHTKTLIQKTRAHQHLFLTSGIMAKIQVRPTTVLAPLYPELFRSTRVRQPHNAVPPQNPNSRDTCSPTPFFDFRQHGKNPSRAQNSFGTSQTRCVSTC